MLSPAVAYYLWPRVWVASRPIEIEEPLAHQVALDEVYRTSLPIGITIKVLQEGVFIFDFAQWSPGRGIPETADPPDYDHSTAILVSRVSILNAHLACLYTAYTTKTHAHPLRNPPYPHEKMLVSPRDLISLRQPGGPLGGELRYDDPVILAHRLRDQDTVSDGLRISVWRPVISTEVVEESCRLLTDVLNHPEPHALLLTELYMRSCRAYEDRNFSLCLVIAWTIAEKLLRTHWARNRMSKGPRNPRTGGHPKAADIARQLHRAGKLSSVLYNDLDQVRVARNNWLHDLGDVSREDAALSVTISQQMLQLVEGLSLRITLSNHLTF